MGGGGYTEDKNKTNNRKRSCPITGFGVPKSPSEDTILVGQDLFEDPVLDPVLHIKIVKSDGTETEYTPKNRDLTQLRTKIQQYKNTYNKEHGGISDLEQFVVSFIRTHQEYRGIFSKDIISFESEKLCKTLPIAIKTEA